VHCTMLIFSQSLQQRPRATMPLKRQNVSVIFALHVTLDGTDVLQPWRWMVRRRPRHLCQRRGLRSGGEARSRGLCSPSMARSGFPRRNEDVMDGSAFMSYEYISDSHVTEALMCRFLARFMTLAGRRVRASWAHGNGRGLGSGRSDEG
jgi:hypothetical protein